MRYSKGHKQATRQRIVQTTHFGLIVGTLQLARALTDRDLPDQLLARGVETALELLDEPGMTAHRRLERRLHHELPRANAG